MSFWQCITITASNAGMFALGAWSLKCAIEHGYAVVVRKHPEHRRAAPCRSHHV